MEDFLKRFTLDDLEKLKVLMSILPGSGIVNSDAIPKNQVTLRVFVDEYENNIKESRSAAYYSSVQCSLKYLSDFWGAHVVIHQITIKQIDEFVLFIQKKAAKGYRVYFRTLKAAFNKAVEWDYIKTNPFSKIKLPKKQKAAPVFVNKKQLNSILGKIKYAIVKDAVSFGFHTGMRLDEIINIKWKHVNIQSRIITVGDDDYTTKGRNQRFIPINEDLLEILLRKKKEEHTVCVSNPKIFVLNSQNESDGSNGYVFHKKDQRKYSGDYFSQVFKKACKAAEMDSRIHFHSLRHSFASNLAQKGVSLYIIKELLGHSSIQTTEIYSHLNLEALRDAINR